MRTAKPRPTESGPHPAGQRLQKVLAAAGVGSRRQCEELITSGRVEVDRRVVTELGTRVDPARQEIRVDGETLSAARAVYYAVNKPTGVVSTNRDPSGRPRVIDLVPSRGARLFPVGRLDLNSEGLILVTNDGELANRLTHPRYEVPKTYVVQVAGKPEPETLAKICRGVSPGRRARPGGKGGDQVASQEQHAVGNGAHGGAEPGNPPAVGQDGPQGAAPGADGHRAGAAGKAAPRRPPAP